MLRLLLVEDDVAIRDLVQWHAERAGYAVAATGDGEDALLLAQEQPPDVIILDWMIESLSGIEVCRRLRRLPATALVPIIMLTARGEESDRVRGLETGADDYVVKPFSPKELMARMAAVMRRAAPNRSADELRQDDITVDRAAHRVLRGDQRIKLGPTEYRLLVHFMENPGRVLSREVLLDAVWGVHADVELRTVDVHIRRLRKAMTEHGGADPIRTVRSAGYALGG